MPAVFEKVVELGAKQHLGIEPARNRTGKVEAEEKGTDSGARAKFQESGPSNSLEREDGLCGGCSVAVVSLDVFWIA